MAGLTLAFQDLRIVALAGLVTGISASFTSGGLTLAGSMNEVENIAGTTTRDSEGYEVTLTFAF